jgi:hypothetical protein
LEIWSGMFILDPGSQIRILSHPRSRSQERSGSATHCNLVSAINCMKSNPDLYVFNPFGSCEVLCLMQDWSTWRLRWQRTRGRASFTSSRQSSACGISYCWSGNQCCGSMAFWCGSGSADPYLWITDMEPAIFVIDLQDAYEKLIFVKRFFCLLLFEGTFVYIIFQR